MKKVVILIGFLLSLQVFAAPATSTDTAEEITLEDLQAEFLKEADTLVVDEEDETFLDSELEKKALATDTPAKAPAKNTVKAPTTETIKK